MFLMSNCGPVMFIQNQNLTLVCFAIFFFDHRRCSIKMDLIIYVHSLLNVLFFFFVTFSTKAPFIFRFNSFYFPINLILDCFIFIFIRFCQFFFSLCIYILCVPCTFVRVLYSLRLNILFV